jgi:hypothetical protein
LPETAIPRGVALSEREESAWNEAVEEMRSSIVPVAVIFDEETPP